MSAIIALYSASTLVSMAIMSLGAALVLVTALALKRLPISIWSTTLSSQKSYWIATIPLISSCVISLIFAVKNPIADLPAPSIHWVKDLPKLWYFAWAPILSVLLMPISLQKQAQILRTWLLVFGLLSLVGVQQFWTGWPRPQPIPTLDGHFHSTLFLGHHLSVASVWIFPFFASLAALMSRSPDGLRAFLGLPRSALFIMVLAGGLTLFFGFSRTLWVALPLGLFFLGFLKIPRNKRLAWGFLLVALLTISGWACYQIPMIRERLTHAMGTTDRFLLWKANLSLLEMRPLTGVGWHHNSDLAGALLKKQYPNQEVFVSHAHNNVLDIAGGLGFFGILAWLGFNFWLATSLWKTSQTPHLPLWARELSEAWLAAFLVFHVNGLTQVNFWEGKVQHQLFWVIAWALLWTHERKTRA